MLKNKTVGSLLIVATLLVTLVPFSLVYSQPQNQEQQNIREQKFMEIATQARERVYELRDFVLTEIGDIPDEIETLLNEADILLAEGTLQKTIEAMNQYRNIYRHLHRYLKQNGVDTETPEQGRGLLVAINRTYLQIEKLNHTMNTVNSTLDETDPKYEEVKTYLEWGWGNLTEAADNLALANQSLYLEQPNIIWAAQNLTEAKNNIYEAHTALKLMASCTNHWRIRNFLGKINRIRERIQERLQQGGFDLGALLQKQGYTSLEDFNQTINNLIESAKQRIEIREAVQDLWTIMNKLRSMELGIHQANKGGQ